jgi:hypothetical protein
VLRGLLEAGFEEHDTLRTDEDLAFLRQSPKFGDLLQEFEQQRAGEGGLFGGHKRRKSSEKGWLDRW